MADAPKGTSKTTTWVVGGLLVLAVVWFLVKRGSGATVIPGTPGGLSDAQVAANSQNFQALAGVAQAMEVGRAQLAIVRAEADAAIAAATRSAQATEEAAKRYQDAQNSANVWGTIKGIGIAAIPFLLQRQGPQGLPSQGLTVV